MMRSRTPLLVGFTALAAAGFLSCERSEPSGPSLAERPAGAPAPIQFKDTPGHSVDVPPNPPSIDDIESALREAGGLATVALKAPENARTGETGYRAAVTAAQAARALEAVVSLGAEVLDFFHAVNIAMVRIPVDRVRAIHASPFVDWVEPAGPRTLATEATKWPGNVAGLPRSLAPAAPHGAMAEVIPWNVSQVNAPAAWSRATGAGAKIMLIGSGIAQHWDNPYVTNCGGLAHSCDSEFINGTLMMGNMLARENGDGVVGVAKGLAASDVYVWRVYYEWSNYYDPWAVYAGFDVAVNLGYKLVLYSFQHSQFDQTEADFIAYLWTQGGITVAPVANHPYPTYIYRYPTQISNVVGVSGVRDDGQFAAYPVPGCYVDDGSGSGPMVDVAGPFWSYTTFTSTQGQQSIIDTRANLGFCSTQMAAAHVAGVIALLQQAHPYPSWSPSQIVTALLSTASNSTTWNEQTGYGIPNADAALNYVPLSATINGPNSVQPNVNCYYWSTVSGGTPPYSYLWSMNGAPISTASDVTVSTGTSNFTLKLEVWATAGAYASKTKSVTVSSGAQQCLQ